MEEEKRAAEEERQPAIALAEYHRKEAEKMEAAKKVVEKAEFKKQEGKVVALRKVNVKVQREVKAKKEVVARSESEKVEGLKKCRQEDGEVENFVTVGSFLTEHRVE